MSSEVQAVIFDRHMWTTDQARDWLKKNDFVRLKRVDQTKNHYRYRITDPKKYARFTMKKTSVGISFVIGWLE